MRFYGVEHLCTPNVLTGLLLFLAGPTGYPQRPLHYVPQAVAVHGPGGTGGPIARRRSRYGY
jgi:hypothetical protein